MLSKEESKKKVSNSKNAVQKSDSAIDSSSPAEKMVREQLGLYVYPAKEKKASTLEVKKSDHPKVSKFNDIDLI